MLEEVEVQCPFCGETTELSVDLTVPEQRYTEDCQVCCHPMSVRVSVAADASTADVTVERESG